METITESVYVHSLSSPEDLVSFIVGETQSYNQQDRLDSHLSKDLQRVKLIVLDSIAALFRAEVNPVLFLIVFQVGLSQTIRNLAAYLYHDESLLSVFWCHLCHY